MTWSQHSTEDQGSSSERGGKGWTNFMFAILAVPQRAASTSFEAFCPAESKKKKSFFTQWKAQPILSDWRTISSLGSGKIPSIPSDHSCAAWGEGTSDPLLQPRSQREGCFLLCEQKGMFHYSGLVWVTPPLAKLNFHYRNHSRWC